MKHHLFKVLTLIVLASMFLAACGGAAPATQPPAQPAEKTKVTIFVGMGTGTDPDQVDAQNQLAQKFNSSHDNIEIEFLIVPHEEYATRYLAMLSGGNAPDLVGPNGISTVAEFFDTWEDITPLARNEWICWIESAKKAQTRHKRIDWGCESLSEGKRRPCCWPGCTHR